MPDVWGESWLEAWGASWAEAIEAINCLFGLASHMSANMPGVSSPMSDSGLGSAAAIYSTLGAAGIMDDAGLGVTGAMSDAGFGVSSELC